MSSQGGRGGGQKLPILLSKKTTKRGGGGQKSPILRRHCLWTAPNSILKFNEFLSLNWHLTLQGVLTLPTYSIFFWLTLG